MVPKHTNTLPMIPSTLRQVRATSRLSKHFISLQNSTPSTRGFCKSQYHMSPPIAILGAGPSGLTLARLLRLAGIDFTIFERDESATSAWGRGGSGTLDLHEGSGLLALQEAGLMEVFRKRARYVHDFEDFELSVVWLTPSKLRRPSGHSRHARQCEVEAW